MNVDPKAVAAAGGNQKNLKKLFTALPESAAGKKVQPLIDHQRNRIDEGVRRNLDQTRHFWAIDRAYDAVLRQETPTLMEGLLDRNPGPKEVESLAKSYGLDRMLTPLTDKDGNALDVNGRILKNSHEKPGYKLNSQVFYNVYVPICLSYLKLRWAKLWSEVDLHPLYKYSPNVLNAKDRAVSKVVTKRVQRMAVDTNLRATERESILRMLLHGVCLNFPMEQWWKDEQKIGKKVKVIREGIRYDIPHTSRIFYDLANPLWTVNSDTGTEYAAYWTIVRAKDIHDNKDYWNNDRLSITAAGWRRSTAWGVYQNMYPCVASFPPGMFETASDNDRQVEAFQYTTDHLNNGIDQTVFFEKLVPKDWGLYDYEYPLWHRFVYAGDRNVIHCEPFFYTPPIAYLYDHDGGRLHNASLAQELLPYQDQLGNLLSQYLLTVRKNLVRVVAVNRDAIGKDFLNQVANSTENSLRGVEFFEYSGVELRNQGVDLQGLFVPLPATQQNATEIIGSINMILNILERALGFSPQEVGAAASHQQSATEIGVTANATSTRLRLTSSFRDDAILARKRALYYGMLHFSDDKIFEEVSDITPATKKHLTDAGFEVTAVDGEPGVVSVKGTKESLVMDRIVSERDGTNRVSDPELAQLLLTFIDRMLQNPNLAQMMGPEQVAKVFNAAGELLGLPLESQVDIGMVQEREKMLRELAEKAQKAEQTKAPAQGQQAQGAPQGAPASQEEVAKALQAVMEQLQQQMAQALQAQQEQVVQAITPIAQKTQELEQAIMQIGQAQQQLTQAFGEGLQQMAQRQMAIEEAVKQIVVAIAGQAAGPQMGVAPGPAAVLPPEAGPVPQAMPPGPLM